MEFWQILLLTAYSAIAIIDLLSTNFGLNNAVVAGFFTGLIMGDLKTGLFIGGSLQLMGLGVATYGGASIPDLTSATIVGTALAVSTGLTAEVAITIAIPVGLLMIQFDILARTINTFFHHQADRYLEKNDLDKVQLMGLIGYVCWALSRCVPVFLAIFFGEGFVEAFMAVIPQFVITGLQVAGGMLPIVGIAILLNYLPTEANLAHLLIGFGLVTYMQVPMIGVALFGIAAALLIYRRESTKSEEVAIDE